MLVWQSPLLRLKDHRTLIYNNLAILLSELLQSPSNHGQTAARERHCWVDHFGIDLALILVSYIRLLCLELVSLVVGKMPRLMV